MESAELKLLAEELSMDGGAGTHGFDRSVADCYKMIRETKIKVDVPDHKGSTTLCDEHLEWYRKVKNHMKGAHRDVHAVLQAIEGRTTEISQADLNRNFGLMIDLDCGQLSTAVFHMLNQLLTGEAHKELSDHEGTQGLEVWRSITINITDKMST